MKLKPKFKNLLKMSRHRKTLQCDVKCDPMLGHSSQYSN